VAEVERGDGVDLPLRQRLKALPFVSTSAVLLLVTANADAQLVANPRRRPVSNVRWQACRRPMDVALRGANSPDSARPPTKVTAASQWVKQSCLSLTRAYIEVFDWCVMDRDETPPTVACRSKPNLPPDYLAGVLFVVVQVRHTRSRDGSKCLLRHVVKISVAEYNVKANRHVAKLRRDLSV
jgi:hypothetical protein